MRTRSEIAIASPAATIFGFASATDRWPELLPHYRSVRVLAQHDACRTVAMAAWRGPIPISWVAEQTDDPLTPSIRFRHVAGATRGMEVLWSFVPFLGGTRVTIDHRLEFAFPLGSDWLAEHVIGKFFIEHVARQTLARMKVLAEAAR
ncbi:MAG: SRPBCC family protein [Candidatus Eremiobacteraeota bacterium]|nr:SRPBCC family protein [Candidatus Eremiobacteraeota bacterium]